MSDNPHKKLGRQMVDSAHDVDTARGVKQELDAGDKGQVLGRLAAADRAELLDELQRRHPALRPAGVPKTPPLPGPKPKTTKPPAQPRAAGGTTRRAAPDGRQGRPPRKVPPRAPQRVAQDIGRQAAAPVRDVGSITVQILGGTLLFAVLYAVLRGEQEGRGVVSFFGKAVTTGLNLFLRPVDPLNPNARPDLLKAAARTNTVPAPAHPYGQAGKGAYQGPPRPTPKPYGQPGSPYAGPPRPTTTEAP